MENLHHCVVCNEDKPENKFRCRKGHGTYVDNICFSCRAARERAQLKLQLIEAFGGRCACCGESHPAFLTLEHKINVGHRHPNARKCHQLIRDAKKDAWDGDKYELLCFNCNCAKEHRGQCPHRSGVTVEQELERLKKIADSRIGFGHRFYGGNQWKKIGRDGNPSNPS